MKTRLALVVVGLALGIAARWIGHLATDQEPPLHFDPVPDEVIFAEQGKANEQEEVNAALKDLSE